MALRRRADVHWAGAIASGTGAIAFGSGAIPPQPIALQTRITDQASGQTSPEELIAAAHGACFAMSVAAVLTGRGIASDAIDVATECEEGPVADGFAITAIHLTVTVAAPTLDQAAIEAVVAEAHATCPVSRALANNVDIRIEARRA